MLFHTRSLSVVFFPPSVVVAAKAAAKLFGPQF